MVAFAMFIFACSLLGVIILFTLKSWEVRRGSVLAPALRERADTEAMHLKAQLLDSRHEISKIVPFLILLIRYLIHEAAIGFAIAAHWLGVQAHKLADLVSHKHRFERQPPRSEYLKQVAQIADRPAVTAPYGIKIIEQSAPRQNNILQPTTTLSEPEAQQVISAPIAAAVAEKPKKTAAKKPSTKKKPRLSKFATSLKSDIVDRTGFEY